MSKSKESGTKDIETRLAAVERKLDAVTAATDCGFSQDEMTLIEIYRSASPEWRVTLQQVAATVPRADRAPSTGRGTHRKRRKRVGGNVVAFPEGGGAPRPDGQRRYRKSTGGNVVVFPPAAGKGL